MDVDMHEMLRRAQRTNVEDAAKYLEAAKIEVGGFEVGIDLDSDDETFTSQLGGLHPIADMGKEFEQNAATSACRLPPIAFRITNTSMSRHRDWRR